MYLSNIRLKVGLLLALSCWLAHSLSAASYCGFIYGRVTTKKGMQYEGQLRWSNQEAAWNDVFNAVKAAPPYHETLDLEAYRQKNQSKETRTFDFDFMQLWVDRKPPTKFNFKCFFGDLDKLRVEGDKVIAILRGGSQIALKNGDLDLFKHILVYDEGLGLLELKWSNILKVDFFQAPATFRSRWGRRIYTKVLTTKGSFEGYVNWDNDETLGNDMIDGFNDKVKHSIRMRDIASIRSDQGGAVVKMISGREVLLNEHADVNRGNRGILIRTPTLGNVQINWQEFISAEFVQPPKNEYCFDSYVPPKPLKGRVYTHEGEEITGFLLFDLDESLDIEMLDGENNGFHYLIPFRLVASITPKNYNYSLVSLKSGQEILLGDHADVTYENHGILVWGMTQHGPLHVPYKNVKKIVVE